MLVDSGKVSLDAPATAYLPGFQLYDNYATREITVRDLLSHRSGLARGELIWYGSDNDRDEILRRVRYLPPTWSFRSQFGYQNIMYLAAGQVVAKVTERLVGRLHQAPHLPAAGHDVQQHVGHRAPRGSRTSPPRTPR